MFLCLFLSVPLYAEGSFPDTNTTVSDNTSEADTDSQTVSDSLAETESLQGSLMNEDALFEKFALVSKNFEELKAGILERMNKERYSKDDIHPADIVSWNKKDFSPITEYEGIGEWTEYPCMKTRLLSDSTGTLRRNWLSGGIDVILDKGCLFKNPVINVDEKVNLENVRFFVPYLFPLTVPQYRFEGRPVFPFIAVPEKKGEDALLAVTLSGELCAKGQECVFVALPMRLSLDGESGDVTSVSAYVHRAFGNIPSFVEKEDMSAVMSSDKTMQVRVKTTSPRGKQKWIVKKEKEPVVFKITEAFVWEEYSYLIFEFDQTVAETELTFTLQDEDVFFERSFKAKEGDFFIKPEVVSFNWLKIALMFFFFSPWLAFVLLFSPKNDWEVRKATTPVVAQVILFSVLALLFLKTGLVYQNPFESVFWRWSMFAVFLSAWLFPIQKSAFSFAVLSFCAPLMYLKGPMDFYPKTTVFICMAVALVPFLYAKKNPHGMLKLWFNFRGLNERVKKLPLLFCAAWILLMQGAVFYNKNADYSLFSPEVVQQNISEGKAVLVLGGDKSCVVCAWNKFYWKKTRARHWFPMTVLKTEDKQPQFLYGPLEPKGIKIPDYMDGYEIEDWFRKVIAEE